MYYQIAFSQWYYKYIDWFSAAAAISEEQYLWWHVNEYYDIPQAEAGTYVNFDSYPPAGWIGWCTDVCTNNGVVPKSIILNYDYDASIYYFVYYVTNDVAESFDAIADDSGIGIWYSEKFPWTVQTAQAQPSADTVTSILTAIGAYNPSV